METNINKNKKIIKNDFHEGIVQFYPTLHAVLTNCRAVSAALDGRGWPSRTLCAWFHFMCQKPQTSGGDNGAFTGFVVSLHKKRLESSRDPILPLSKSGFLQNFSSFPCPILEICILTWFDWEPQLFMCVRRCVRACLSCDELLTPYSELLLLWLLEIPHLVNNW